MKKIKDMKVEITFAESKEYDSVKETFIGRAGDNPALAKEKRVPGHSPAPIKKRKQKDKRRGKRGVAQSRRQHGAPQKS